MSSSRAQDGVYSRPVGDWVSSRQGEEREDVERGADGSEGGRRGSGEELVQAHVVIFAPSFGQGLELQQCNI